MRLWWLVLWLHVDIYVSSSDDDEPQSRRLVADLHVPDVTVIERNPVQRVFGSLSMPEGSPWCHGQPTYWLVGHQSHDESPYCYNGVHWLQNSPAVLDTNDLLNQRDTNRIDRHQCVSFDINRDTLTDVICLVGADKATGEGYNELYLTQPDGSLRKVLEEHGLQKYPSMSTRLAVHLHDKRGRDLVFVTTSGIERSDGKPNQHRMFKNVYRKERKKPYFEEVWGPWIRYNAIECAVAGDINGDGIDDLVLCTAGQAILYEQSRKGKWSRVPGLTGEHLSRWGNVRIEDVTGDGLNDLIVVGYVERGTTQRSFLKVFRGMRRPPYFNFRTPYYFKDLPHASPDVEILDVNQDGIKDIYVVQTNYRTGYCASNKPFQYWGGSTDPPDDWFPPYDIANDLLFIGMRTSQHYGTIAISRNYQAGCGYWAQRFGDYQTMILSYGDRMHNGQNLLLKW